ncbi:MAG: DnaJ domain-containing protein [Nitrospinota bacterium]|nr:DnaJ domain-containing protein [Nitrospinota bacterium]
MKTPTKEYYRILGVPENATEVQIKKSYRRLAMEHHPDRNPNDSQSEDRFKEITEAYGVLMDPIKRREYDQYRTSPFPGAQGGPQFRYSQQEIFENMFRQAFGRDMFNDLNTDFRQSGFRTGPDFFGPVFFGAAGGIGKFLRMIPGPIGKIGTGLWLLSSVGSSLYALKKGSQTRKTNSQFKTKKETASFATRTIKNLFQKPGKSPSGNDDPNIYYHIVITPGEARMGTKKQISYRIGEKSENIQVHVPPGISSGKKLRLREKGPVWNEKRGDLILTVQIKS